MRLLFPVSFMTVAAASCCCCGGSSLEDIQKQVEAFQSGETTTVTMDAGDGGTKMSTGTAAGGACGSFKADGLSLPSGFTVTVCSEMGGTDSLIAQGSGDTKAACGDLKGWATGKGYKVTTEANLGDVSSVLAERGDKRLTIACSTATGKPTLSLAVTPK